MQKLAEQSSKYHEQKRQKQNILIKTQTVDVVLTSNIRVLTVYQGFFDEANMSKMIY